MALRSSALRIVVAAVACLVSRPGVAGDVAFQDYRLGPVPTELGRQMEGGQVQERSLNPLSWPARTPATGPGRWPGQEPWPTRLDGVGLATDSQPPWAFDRSPEDRNGLPEVSESRPRWLPPSLNATVPLPPTAPPRSETVIPAGTPLAGGRQPVAGTWREDGRFLILNVNGQELRLVKEAREASPGSSPGQGAVAGGGVLGRLSHGGSPLANCQVKLVPLTKGLMGYTTSRRMALLTTTTDEQGGYWFENVPPGAYKLSWLPAGENQWIRRIALRPDVVVRADETARAKEIRTALRTLN